MNMKRRIIALLTLVIMLFSMVGCSKEGLALMKETYRVNAWEITDLATNVSLLVQAEGMKIGAKVEVTGWFNTKTLQGEMELSLKEIKMNDEVIEEISFSPVKVFMDQQVVYISKTYFTELFTSVGAPMLEEFNAIQADYIGFETATIVGTPQVDPKKANDLFMKLMDKAKVDVAVKQDKKNFTIEMNSDQLVDATVALLIAAMDDIDAINAIAPTGNTQEEIDKEKKEVQAMLVDGKNEVKPMVSGSNLKVNYNFEDNKYTNGIDLNIQWTDGENKVTAQMKMDGTFNKLDKKEFVLPKNAVILPMEEYMN